MKLYFNILLLFFFLLCLGTLFLNSTSFVSAQTTPKYYAFLFFSAAILLILALCSIFSDIKNLPLNKLILPVCFIISVLCLAQALYGIAQYLHLFPAFGGHRVSGSFDNPAGFTACLSAGFPFFFYFLPKKRLWIRCLSICGMTIVVSAVLLSGSRAGMLALLIVCLSGSFYLFRFNTKQKIVIGIFLAILITGLYFMKKDSADGRLLIWQCSWEMIKDKPLIGHGTGGFNAEYMNYQAKYFEKYPDSKYSMLAGNVNRPFNEYIGLWVDYGLLGLSLFVLLLYCVIRAYRQNSKKTLLTYIACWSLTAIVVFAFFSYSLRYPFVWVMGLLSCVILFRKSIFPILILLLIPVVCIQTYHRLTTEMKWSTIAHTSLAGQTEQMLPEYKLLYSKWHNNELFLYNYAAELNFAQYYEESLTIAHECEQLWADYDLQMLIADNYLQMKDYPKAEQHYRKATAMVPVKFMPLYKLFQLYETTSEKEKMQKIAKIITAKPVKILSPKVIQIKNKVKRKTDSL